MATDHTDHTDLEIPPPAPEARTASPVGLETTGSEQTRASAQSELADNLESDESRPDQEPDPEVEPTEQASPGERQSHAHDQASQLAGEDQPEATEPEPTGPEGADQPAGVPELTEAEQHRCELGLDPATGKFNAHEANAGLKIERLHGVTLERHPDPHGPDWYVPNPDDPNDKSSRTYDLIGPIPNDHFDEQWDKGQIQTRIGDHTEKATFVPVDVSWSTEGRATQVQRYIDENDLGPQVFLLVDDDRNVKG